MTDGAWQAIVHGEVSRVRQDLATKLPPNIKLYLKKSKRGPLMELEESGEHLGLGRNFPPPREAEEKRWCRVQGLLAGNHRSSRRADKLASRMVSRGGGQFERVEEGGSKQNRDLQKPLLRESTGRTESLNVPASSTKLWNVSIWFPTLEKEPSYLLLPLPSSLRHTIICFEARHLEFLL